jgi:hypothetical protein
MCAMMLGMGCRSESVQSLSVQNARPARGATELVREVLNDLPASPSDGLTRETSLVDPSGRALAPFYDALARSARNEGSTRLVFYGGSHTASDLYTGAIRTRLQARFGDKGHGFVLAAPPITSYWQQGARVAEGEGWTTLAPSAKRMGIDAYGIAGLAFEARQDAWAQVATDRTHASRVEVMYLRQRGGGRLEVSIDGVSRVLDSESDVEEPAIDVVAVPDGEHRVELRALGEDAPVRIYGVVFEREGPGVVVDQLAIAGAKARHQLLWEQSVWLPLLRSRNPDLIAFSYGNNELDDAHLSESEHEAHFAAMITRVRRAFPGAACLVIGPSDRQMWVSGRWVTPAALPFFVEMQQRVAVAEGCAFFDVLQWQGGPSAVLRWLEADPPLMREDRIHFTESAYRRLGHDLLRAMLTPMSASR